MKISKLFHWLYCAVMFLPLIMFLPNAFYYGFNEHATNNVETQVDIQYKYESNEVNSINDIEVGKIYNINIEDTTIDGYFQQDNSIFYFDLLNVYYYDFSELQDINLDDFINVGRNNTDFRIGVTIEGDGETYLSFYITQGDYIASFYLGNLIDDSFSLNADILITQMYGLYDYTMFSYTDYNIIESVEVEESQTSITDKMYLGWEKVWQLPVFSWTQNTFFTAPFNYISSLFGFQAGNSISYLLSYWFSISIIWLVFDLMIYVPLLVHRWLDKASLS